MAKFKELPKKEQEGYVIAYTNAIKVKTYQLCYRCLLYTSDAADD